MPECVMCGVEFEGRSDARFCGATCRKRASRHVTDIPVTDPDVTDKKPIGHTSDGAPYYAPGRFDDLDAFQARVEELSFSMPTSSARRYAAKELAGTSKPYAHESERLRTHESQIALQREAAKLLDRS